MGLIGIDEVGRGCWAGPLLVVAVRAVGELPEGLTDSKALTKQARERFAELLEIRCVVGEGWVAASEIDELGLTEAMKVAVARALKMLDAADSDEIIMDGNYNYCPPNFSNVTCIIKADGIVPEVSAASIVAKVKRDDYMGVQAKNFPGYGFEKHVGYGTAAHIVALKTYGICDLHRKSYKPIQKIMKV